jgi:hypothetical protein
MKLFTNCIACQEQIAIKSYASTRSDLEQEKGASFRLNCNYCGKDQEKHVNDVRAKGNHLIIIVGIVLSVIVTILLWNVFGAIGGVSVGIPLLIWQQQNSTVNTFNSYLVRRR